MFSVQFQYFTVQTIHKKHEELIGIPRHSAMEDAFRENAI
jgi:hypothetical protein